jgi:predicted GNAT family acetyltransferase
MHKIQNEFDGKSGTFFLEIDGKRLAIMNYSMPDNKNMIVEHTEVDDSLKGQGIGKKLVIKLVEHARENQIRVRSFCPFVTSVLNRNEEWQDILS